MGDHRLLIALQLNVLFADSIRQDVPQTTSTLFLLADIRAARCSSGFPGPANPHKGSTLIQRWVPRSRRLSGQNVT